MRMSIVARTRRIQGDSREAADRKGAAHSSRGDAMKMSALVLQEVHVKRIVVVG